MWFYVLGYIGLPLASVLANSGVSVIGYDINEKRIKDLRKNILPFYEKDLLKFFKLKRKGNLKITNKFNFNAQYFIVCLGTELVKKKFL